MHGATIKKAVIYFAKFKYRSKSNIMCENYTAKHELLQCLVHLATLCHPTGMKIPWLTVRKSITKQQGGVRKQIFAMQTATNCGR